MSTTGLSNVEIEACPIGIVGAGVIGRSLAQALLQIGRRVTVVDTSQEALDETISSVRTWSRLSRLYASQGSDSQAPDEILSRLTVSTQDTVLNLTEIVIENITEDPDLKLALYPRLDEVCSSAAVIAANTSAIGISMLSEVVKKKERIIGMHFMNPVPLTRLVEVIRGRNTSQRTVDIATQFVSSISREAVVVNDSPGFVSNRVMMLTVNEAVFLVQESVASVEDVDRIFKLGFGHKMGPLETADLIGLDTVLNSLNVLHDSFKDPKFRPCSLLQEMVTCGALGRKSGRGFYTYEA